MRILLISANRERFPEPVFPIGLVYLANSLMHSGAVIRIFDMQFQRFPLVSLRKEISRFRPDAIGISLRNVDNAAYPCTRFYLPSYRSLINTIRSISDAHIIVGGAAFSIFPEAMYRLLDADTGIVGEGENSFSQFGRYRDKGIVTETLTDLANVQIPQNIEEVFPQFRRYRTVGIQTARGCRNVCIYCTYPLLEGRTIRTRPPEGLAEEIAFLRKGFGKRDFFIVDSIFNSHEEHMVEVLERIISKKLDIRMSCYLQPKISDPAIFRLLRRAGCVAVDFGTDSGSPALLHSMRKSFSVEDIRKVSHACRSAGIDFCHSLVFGGPGETIDTIRETVDLIEEVSPKAAIAMTGIRVYPGTEMQRIALSEGSILNEDSLIHPTFYFSGLGSSMLIKEVFEAVSGRRNWFFPGERDWSRSVGPRLLYFLYRKGPLWRTFTNERRT